MKRKREPAFAASEKNRLIELVEKYFQIIENKKTDNITIRAKNEQWQKIAIEFNATSFLHPRDSISLKTCWENLKKRAKSLITLRNQHHLATGGGPPKKFNEDPIIERVSEIIQTRVTGFVNPFDTDGDHVLATGSSTADASSSTADASSSAAVAGSSTAEAEVEATLTSDNLVFETQVPTERAETCTAHSIDWSQYNAGMLREPRNPVLARSRTPSPHMEQIEVFNILSDIHESEAQNSLPTPLSAPQSETTTSARASRRRPVLRREQSLNEERIKTLLTTNAFAEEEHRMNMIILKVQEQSEREKLVQEKLKTEQEKIKLEILKLELNKLKE